MKTKEYFFDSLPQAIQDAFFKRIVALIQRRAVHVEKVEFYAVEHPERSQTYLDHLHGRGKPILRAKITVTGEEPARRWFWTGKNWRNA